jgi:hypothetical protein
MEIDVGREEVELLYNGEVRIRKIVPPTKT